MSYTLKEQRIMRGWFQKLNWTLRGCGEWDNGAAPQTRVAGGTVSSGGVSVSWVCHNQLPQTGGLEQQNSLRVLEAGYLKSRRQRAVLSLKTTEEPFHASPSLLVVCQQSLAFLGLQIHHFNPPTLHGILAVSLPPHDCLLIRTPIILDEGPILPQYDLI